MTLGLGVALGPDAALLPPVRETGKQAAGADLGEGEHPVKAGRGGVAVVLVVADGRVGADEAEVVDAGLDVDAGGAAGRGAEHVVEHPEGFGEGVADAGLAAAGEAVDLDEAEGETGGLRCRAHLRQHGGEVGVGGEKFGGGAGRVLVLAVVVVGEELEVLLFAGGEGADPTGGVEEIGAGERNVGQALEQGVTDGFELVAEVLVGVGLGAVLAPEEIGLVADLDGEEMGAGVADDGFGLVKGVAEVCGGCGRRRG